MAKKRKRRPPMSTDVLESHREWLIRCVLIGQGYVYQAMETTDDAAAYKTYKRHYDEMQRVIDGVRPDAEDVLKILGSRIASARADVEDALRYAKPLAEMNKSNDSSIYAVVNHAERALERLGGAKS